MRRIDRVLGVISFSDAELEPQLRQWLEDRGKAKESGDYSAADTLRDQLAAAVVQVIDTPQGQRWRKTTA
jgi:cysteinyl-tRNA synthetase